MRLYSAGQIVERLHGVTTRQILDLAEKGLIIPARETTGQGSPRLYDFKNIFEICVCVALRAKLPGGGKTIEIINIILQVISADMELIQKRETEKEFDRCFGKGIRPEIAIDYYEPNLFPPSFDLLRIAYDDHDNFTVIPVTFDNKRGSLEAILSKSKKSRPQHFCTYILEVAELWEYLMVYFGEESVININVDIPTKLY